MFGREANASAARAAAKEQRQATMHDDVNLRRRVRGAAIWFGNPRFIDSQIYGLAATAGHAATPWM